MIKKVWRPQTQRNPHSCQQFQPKSSGKAAATAVAAAIPAKLREGKARVRPSITSCLGEEAQLALVTTVKPAMQSAVLVTEETSQGNNTKIKPQTQEKMHFLHPPFSMEMVLIIVIAGGGKPLLGRNTVSQRSLSACNEIGRKQPGLEHEAKASEKLPSTQHREKKKALSGLTSGQKYIRRMLFHVKLHWHAPSARASRWSVFLALPLF